MKGGRKAAFLFCDRTDFGLITFTDNEGSFPAISPRLLSFGDGSKEMKELLHLGDSQSLVDPLIHAH